MNAGAANLVFVYAEKLLQSRMSLLSNPKTALLN